MTTLYLQIGVDGHKRSVIPAALCCITYAETCHLAQDTRGLLRGFSALFSLSQAMFSLGVK